MFDDYDHYKLVVQRCLIQHYGVTGDPDYPDVPMHGVPDGVYPMIIDGVLHVIQYVDNRIFEDREFEILAIPVATDD